MTPLIESLRALKLGTSSVRAAVLQGHLRAFTPTDLARVMLCARASTREGAAAAAAARRCRRAAERDPGVTAGAATALPPPPPKAIASARAPTRRTGLCVSAMATPSATMARPHSRTATARATARATASPPAQAPAVARRTPTQRRLHLLAGARTVPNPRRPPQRRRPAHRPCRPGFASWRGRFNRLCRAPPHRHRRPPPSRGFQ